MKFLINVRVHQILSVEELGLSRLKKLKINLLKLTYEFKKILKLKKLNVANLPKYQK